jgi:hypothetical protein
LAAVAGQLREVAEPAVVGVAEELELEPLRLKKYI